MNVQFRLLALANHSESSEMDVKLNLLPSSSRTLGPHSSQSILSARQPPTIKWPLHFWQALSKTTRVTDPSQNGQQIKTDAMPQAQTLSNVMKQFWGLYIAWKKLNNKMAIIFLPFVGNGITRNPSNNKVKASQKSSRVRATRNHKDRVWNHLVLLQFGRQTNRSLYRTDPCWENKAPAHLDFDACRATYRSKWKRKVVKVWKTHWAC